MKKFAVLAMGAGLLVSSEVMAEGMYFEVDYLKLDMAWSTPSAVGDFVGGSIEGIDASPPAIGIKIGSQFNKNLALEAMFGFGTSDDDFLSASDVSFTGEFNSVIGVNALGTIPVADNFKIYGKIGFAQVDVDLGFNASGLSQSYSSDDTGILFGAGFVIDVTEKSAFALEYIKLPDVNVDVLGTDFGKIKTTSINFGYKGRF